MNLREIPLFDHHCHPLRREAGPLDASAFRLHFTESRDPAMADHVATSVVYRRALRDLAGVLGCEPDEAALLKARSRLTPETLDRLYFGAAGISALLVDTGYGGPTSHSLEEMRALVSGEVREVLRLETLAEELITETKSFNDFEESYRQRLRNARERGFAAFKSIAAYRGGLENRSRTRAEAAAAYSPLKEGVRRQGAIRLESRALLEFLLRIAMEAAAAQELPVQFHTGFGDDDADLRLANPLHLRSLFQDPALRGAPVVLLHCYPFCREAGYLASLYANAYVDLSLTIPLTAHGGTRAILAALELAPISKLLLATDASRIPELFYLGALYARRGLSSALAYLHARSWLTTRDAEDAARNILHDNAARLYAAVRGRN